MNIIQIYQYFPTEKDCIAHIESMRWKGKVCCPYCQFDRCSPMPKEQRHHCNNCKISFSMAVGTISHSPHFDLQNQRKNKDVFELTLAQALGGIK